MQIEMLVDNYASAQGFKLRGAGIHDVETARARYLLSTFPSWFRAVDGQTESDEKAPLTPAQPNLKKLKKDELLAHAASIGLTDLDPKTTNDDIIAAIEAQEPETSTAGSSEPTRKDATVTPKMIRLHPKKGEA